jgi:ribosomal-protein-alanine N-acetyltransferase
MLNHKGTVELATKNLILRQFITEDAKDMYMNWASDNEVSKFLTWPAHSDISVSQEVIDSWIEQYQKLNYYNWVIVLKETGEAIGSIAAVKQDDNIRMVTVGYCIGRRWWHQGYTSEALSCLVKFFFEEVGVNRIEAQHDINNPNSGKVMQKAGLHSHLLTVQFWKAG